MKPSAKVLIAVVVAIVVSALLWMITRGESSGPVTLAPLVLPQLPSTGAPTARPSMAPSVFPTEAPQVMGYMDPDDDDYGML